ncbi:rRNA maturation RNase YbeY [Candidatus Peregrinibacteria bacterium]|nr:rRNA maturation RNase YbeY [Candidatus Peregrinibacteria bacterium]
MFHLEIHNRVRSSISKELFFKLLLAAEKCLLKTKRIRPRKNYRLELTLVGEIFMQRLNKMYHKKNRQTDVISLSYFKPSMQDDFAGEIFICVPFALRQAKKIGQPLAKELQFLFIHGLLHCFGYDHKKLLEEVRMKRMAYKILGRT